MLRRAQAGDRAALEGVLRSLHGPLHRMASRMVLSHSHLVEDVVQETLIKVAAGLSRFRPDGAATVATWAMRIGVNVAIDTLRRAQRESGRRQRFRQAAPSVSAAPDLERHVLVGQIYRTLEALPPELRAALILRAYHDMDYAEIAEVLDVPVGTVKSRISRARTALRQQLSRGEANA